jgi:hypothetical protein
MTTLQLPDNRVVTVDSLSVSFTTSERTVQAVRNLSSEPDPLGW